MKKSVGAHPLLYPNPVLIVGTYDEKGSPNMMAAAWGGVACSKPPCVSISLRKATYTYSNIQRSKAFTVNIPSAGQVVAADFAGMVSGRDTDKFKAAGLTPVKSDKVDAPMVGEFPVSLECRLAQAHDLGLHTIFIGEIVDIKADEKVLGANGLPLLEKVNPVLFGSGGSSVYHGVGDKLGDAFSIGGQLKKK